MCRTQVVVVIVPREHMNVYFVLMWRRKDCAVEAKRSYVLVVTKAAFTEALACVQLAAPLPLRLGSAHSFQKRKQQAIALTF